MTTYTNPSILVFDTNPLYFSARSIIITFSLEIKLSMESISNIVNTYNDFRNSSVIFVKGIDDEVDQQVIIVYERNIDMLRKVNIYNVPSDSEHLSYSTSHGRWIYRITNPDLFPKENNMNYLIVILMKWQNLTYRETTSQD